MTLYLIYLINLQKEEKTLYAYTTLKDIKDQFLIERNPSLFEVKKMEGDEDDIRLRSIMNTYSNLKLIEEVVTDGKKTFVVYMTQNESQFFTESCEEIRNNILDCSKVLLAISFRTEILNAIKGIVDLFLETEKKENMMPINTFKVYYSLFNDTFHQSKGD